MHGIYIHACLYCESEKSINAGTLRTFGSLDIHLSEFQAAGEKKETAQLYKNVIRKRLIHLNEDPEVKVINKIPPSSLHIFMGFFNVLNNLVFTLWPNFNQWLSGKYIFRHGYHGGGFDGVNCNKILNNLQDLEVAFLNDCRQLLMPIITCFKDLKCVVDDFSLAPMSSILLLD